MSNLTVLKLDSSRFQLAMKDLEEKVLASKALHEIIERFFSFPDLLAKLGTVKNGAAARGAGLIVFLEPTDFLVDLLAAFGTANFERLLIKGGHGDFS